MTGTKGLWDFSESLLLICEQTLLPASQTGGRRPSEGKWWKTGSLNKDRAEKDNQSAMKDLRIQRQRDGDYETK